MVEGDEHGAGHVGLGVLLRLADIEQGDTVQVPGRQLAHVDLGDGHRRRVGRRREIAGMVGVGQGDGRYTGDRAHVEVGDRPVDRPLPGSVRSPQDGQGAAAPGAVEPLQPFSIGGHGHIGPTQPFEHPLDRVRGHRREVTGQHEHDLLRRGVESADQRRQRPGMGLGIGIDGEAEVLQAALIATADPRRRGPGGIECVDGPNDHGGAVHLDECLVPPHPAAPAAGQYGPAEGLGHAWATPPYTASAPRLSPWVAVASPRSTTSCAATSR